MKKKIAILAVLLLTLLLSGCTTGSYNTLWSTEINTFSKMSMNYKKFNGYKQTWIIVKEDEQRNVKADIVTEEGKLYLSITDKDGKSFYQGNDLPTSSFTVVLDKKGEYKIKVSAENHKGSYKIIWDKVKKE